MSVWLCSQSAHESTGTYLGKAEGFSWGEQEFRVRIYCVWSSDTWYTLLLALSPLSECNLLILYTWVTEWWRLEGTSGDRLVQAPSSNRVTWSMLRRIVTREVLNIPNLSGQPVPALCHPCCKEVSLHVQVELSVLQFVPVVSYPVTGHNRKESSPILLTWVSVLLFTEDFFFFFGKYAY